MHTAAKGHACRTDPPLDRALWIKCGCIVTKHTDIAVCRLQIDDDFVASGYDCPISESDLGFCTAPGFWARGVQSHTFEDESL